jgi:hypothetical protein
MSTPPIIGSRALTVSQVNPQLAQVVRLRRATIGSGHPALSTVWRRAVRNLRSNSPRGSICALVQREADGARFLSAKGRI